MSLRGRLGVAIGPALLYGTGGVAHAKADLEVTATNGVQTVSMSKSFSETGYVFGGGIEYMFRPTLVGRLEGLRYQFNGIDGTSEDYKVDVIRGGLSVKF